MTKREIGNADMTSAIDKAQRCDDGDNVSLPAVERNISENRLASLAAPSAARESADTVYNPPSGMDSESFHVPQNTGTHVYCDGVAYNIVDFDISKATFLRLCLAIEQHPVFAGYTCFPQPITEGGILFCGKRGYKCVRLYIDDWPRVDLQNVRQQWEADDTVVWASATSSTRPYPYRATRVIVKNKTLYKHFMFAKAFNGASGWTRDEIWALHDVFAVFGIHMKMTYFKRRKAGK